jgi:hypothetical protein
LGDFTIRDIENVKMLKSESGELGMGEWIKKRARVVWGKSHDSLVN